MNTSRCELRRARRPRVAALRLLRCSAQHLVGGELYFGSAEVVAKLLEEPFVPPAWEFMGCDPPTEQNYDVCWFDTGEIAGIGHGVSVEVTIFTTPSTESSVDGLEFYR